MTDRYGNVTKYHYDSSGRIQEIVDPVGLRTQFGYSGDRVSQIVDPAGRITKLSYSGADLTPSPTGRIPRAASATTAQAA